MTKIPEQQVRTPEEMFANLQKWWQMQQQLAKLKTTEVLERKDMVGYYFPSPREGTNRLDVGGGFDLRLVFGYSRNVDEAALDSAKASDFKKLKIDKDSLFAYKPELVVKEYKKLSDEQRAFIDELLDVKESTPQLHIVPRAQSDADPEITEVPVATTKRAPRKAAAKAPAKKTAAKKAPAKTTRARK